MNNYDSNSKKNISDFMDKEENINVKSPKFSKLKNNDTLIKRENKKDNIPINKSKLEK